MSVLHLRTACPYPPNTPGLLRLYGMKYCPYSQSTRLVLAHKNIPHEVVNIHLKQKPEWYKEKSPLGTTPCLEFDGKTVFDSKICNYYLDGAYPQKQLVPSDPYERAVMEMWIERYVSTVNGHCAYLCWTGAANDLHCEEKCIEAQKGLEPFEQLLSDKRQFFGGDDLNMLDIRMWPMLEKTDFIKGKAGIEVLDPKRFPNLRAWRENMFKTPAAIGGGTDLVNLPKLRLDLGNDVDYDVGVKV